MRTVSESASGGRVVPAQARTVAGRLAALFEADSQLARRLSDAQHRLRAANDRLGAGLAFDPLGVACDRAAPGAYSHLTTPFELAVDGSGPASTTPAGGALQEIQWAIDRAFCEYQTACEERRQLAFEVGELAQQLTDALIPAGWSVKDAQTADVHQLARREPGR